MLWKGETVKAVCVATRKGKWPRQLQAQPCPGRPSEGWEWQSQHRMSLMAAPPSSLQRPINACAVVSAAERGTSILTMLPWLAPLFPRLPPERREPCPLLPGRPGFPHYARKLRKHLHLNQQVKTQGQREVNQVQEEAGAFS